MPDKDGILTEEERRKVIAWLGERAHNPICSMCGTTKWILADSMPNPSIYYAEGVRIGGPTVPMVGIVCSNCGHMVFFSAIAMGLVSSGNEAKEQQAAPQVKPSIPEGVSNG